jgi:hypothetical protein
VLALTGGLAFLGVWYSNTGKTPDEPFTNVPVQRVPKSPASVPLTARDRGLVRAVAFRFISTAVLRHDVADSWELTAPVLRQGLSREQWARGEIPVVPYPNGDISTAKWRLVYSYQNRVGFRVAFPERDADSASGQLFDIELVNLGSSSRPRWLVSFWAPSAGTGRPVPPAPGAPTEYVPPNKGGSAWILVPIVLIGGTILLVPTFLLLRGWVHHHRAKRAHRRFERTRAT